jgi:anti-sigma regulatory factor (Ser/Thr protein kinase)
MLTRQRTRVTIRALVATDESLHKSYRAVPASVPRARNAVVAFAATRGVRGSQLDAIRLAVSEAVSNAVVHAYDDGGQESIQVTAGFVSGELWVRVTDDGRGFAAPARRPGLGWGLPLIAHATDGFEIAEPADGGTELRLRFAVEVPIS